MLLFQVPLAWIGLLVLILLHIPAVFLKDPYGTILSYLDVALHAAYLFVLATAGFAAQAPEKAFTIEEAVLLYMISLFCYTVCYTVRYLRARRAQNETVPTDGGKERNA